MSLKELILDEYLQSSYFGHPGYQKMLTTIRNTYFWLGMRKNIAKAYFWPGMRKKYPFHF